MASPPINQVVQELKEIEQGNSSSHSNSQNQHLQTSSMFDKSLSCAENIAQLLPTGTVLAFQALSSSFTHHGQCFNSNKYLTALLLASCFLSCIVLCFTDSLMGRDGKLYYGLATFKGFYLFNLDGSDDEAWQLFNNLQELRIKTIDYVHAFFSAIVFLSISFSDAGVRSCFFQSASHNTTELLVNLPLGAAVLSSFVFMIFPTKRKGIGYTNVNHRSS